MRPGKRLRETNAFGIVGQFAMLNLDATTTEVIHRAAQLEPGEYPVLLGGDTPEEKETTE